MISTSNRRCKECRSQHMKHITTHAEERYEVQHTELFMNAAAVFAISALMRTLIRSSQECWA